MKISNWKTKREDYALQVVPEAYRTWSWVSLMSVLFGISTAMMFFVMGAQWVEIYGAKNLILAMIATTAIIGTIGFVLAVIASEVGLDMDLITSGSGMGYKGAGITSFIYASAFVIYFGIEGSIIAAAAHSLLPSVSISYLYLIVGLMFIPLTWYGLTTLNWVMWATLPLCVALVIRCVMITAQGPSVHFLSAPPHPTTLIAIPLLLQLLALAPTSALGIATVAADIGRFIPKQKRIIGAISISYILSTCCFLGMTLLGAWIGLKLHLQLGDQSNPGNYIPILLGTVWGAFFVIVTQVRINSINIYTSSLAFATFFSRLFNISPGRHWWIILTAVLATLLMFGDLINHLNTVLIFLAVFLTAWVISVLSYILFNRYLFKLSPKNFAYQKGSIPDYNPIGLTALILAIIVALPMALGLYGTFYQTIAPLFASGIAFITVPIMTFFLVKICGHRKYVG